MGPWRFPILTFALVGLRLVFANRALIWDVMSLSGGPYHHVAGILPFMRLILDICDGKARKSAGGMCQSL